MSGPMDPFATTAFGLLCANVGFLVGWWYGRRLQIVDASIRDADIHDDAIDVRCREWAEERGTPEAAPLVADLARIGVHTARRTMPRTVRRRRWSWR